LKRSDRYQGNSATPTSSANTLESSTFHITLPHLRDDNDEMFRRYLLAITTLNVDGAGRSIRKNFLHRLEDLLSPESCPNIVSIIFRNMHDAQVLRAWVEMLRRTSNRPIWNVVYENCTDSDYLTSDEDDEEKHEKKAAKSVG
jgi:hypothetical protein